MSRSTTRTTKRTTDYAVPGKFLVVIQPNTAPPKPHPPVIGHCLLCLRRLCAPTAIQNLKMGETFDDLRIVPKAVLNEEDLLPTFNKLLPFIHRKWKPKGKKDPLDLLNKNVPEYPKAPDSGSGGGPSNLPKNFPHLPAMCTMCGQSLEQLDGLIRQLGGKIEEIKEIIRMSKMPKGEFGWRQLQFEDDLRNNQDLNEMSRKRTMEFLEEFGEVEEEDDEEMVENEEEEVVEATDGQGGGGEEEDPLAFNENEGEEDGDIEIKVEMREEEVVEEVVEEEWSPAAGVQVKEEPEFEAGPSYQSVKRARRSAPGPGPASKTGRQPKRKIKILISESLEERREEEDDPTFSPRRSSRITIDKSRTINLSSSLGSSAVVENRPDQFHNG